MITTPEIKIEKLKRKYRRKAVDDLSSNLDGVSIQSIKLPSAEPSKDPAVGDKTPEYVEWYRDNHTPEEFAAKYGHRKHHLNHPKYDIIPATGTPITQEGIDDEDDE